MKAVLYCRISTSTPFALDMIRGQQLRLLDYAKEKGIEVAGMYSDVGCLGSTLDNPGVQAVIQAVRDGKADTILVTDRDRLNKGVRLEELQSLPVIALSEEEGERNGRRQAVSCDPELAALLSQPWSEGACRGYVISDMERSGFRPVDIERVMRELHEVFGFTTLEEAQALYERSPY